MRYIAKIAYFYPEKKGVLLNHGDFINHHDLEFYKSL